MCASRSSAVGSRGAATILGCETGWSSVASAWRFSISASLSRRLGLGETRPELLLRAVDGLVQLAEPSLQVLHARVLVQHDVLTSSLRRHRWGLIHLLDLRIGHDYLVQLGAIDQFRQRLVVVVRVRHDRHLAGA